jgi:hypothetical protein
LLTLFIPLRAGQANPVANVMPGADGHSATVKFTDGRSFLISAPGDRGITAEETLYGGNAGRRANGGGN